MVVAVVVVVVVVVVVGGEEEGERRSIFTSKCSHCVSSWRASAETR